MSEGFYWVDPNGGGPEDAIHVYCNFRTKETCIDADQAVYSVGAEKQSATEDFTWLGEVASYGNLLYKVEGAQLVMLKARSLGAHQTLTVSCSKDLKLYSDNEIELTSNGVHAKFSVVSNTCQVSLLAFRLFGRGFCCYGTGCLRIQVTHPPLC